MNHLPQRRTLLVFALGALASAALPARAAPTITVYKEAS
jgi:hypothetical protein